MENLLENLNEEQKQALLNTEGAVLVTAGAGSGKTRLLTYRIAYLIQEKQVPAWRILAITFTNKAANEMKERVSKLVPSGNEVWTSTFHSMCAKILRVNIEKLGEYSSSFSIYSEADTDKVLSQIFKEKNIEDEKLKKKIKFHISNFKNSGLQLNTYLKDFEFDNSIDYFRSVFNIYENNLKKSNALDFDDLLLKTQELFLTCPDVLNYYANKFLYVLVDEFQDTNTVQFELVKMLSSQNKNIFAVGDEDQCIYSWRGANYKNIFRFKDEFENVQVFKLERNYRSTKTILDTANKLISNNKSRLDKVLWTDKIGGKEVEFAIPYDEQDEADRVAHTIKYMVNEQGYKYSDFAVLMRLNALSFPIEEKFLNYNIPHKIFGGFKFFERQEIKCVIAYLRLFVNPKDDVSFLRVINFPKRGIGDSAIQKLTEIAKMNSQSLLECSIFIVNKVGDAFANKFKSFVNIYEDLYKNYEQTPLTEFVKDVISKFSIKFAYQGKEEDLEKAINIDSFISSVDAFETKNKNATLVQYLENVSLISDIDSYDDSNNVIIATVHSVKGLEFKCVFVVGMEENIFPISRASGKTDEIEEERRLAYVAITRAQERLFITACRTRYMYGRREYMLPSRFIGEMGVGSLKQTVVAQPVQSKTIYKPNVENKVSVPEKDVSIYEVGKMVLHPKFGIGKIVNIDGKLGDINFNGIGIKTLLLDIAPLKIIKD